jgi:murein DD-endopeptidase MepM/ murein hydrolase activator NlpD
MVNKFLSCALLFLSLSSSIFAQDVVQTRQYPKDYFRYPLDLPPSTAGSFGELRPNHFHAGLDFRTNQRDGYPVHAAADGFVSRLKVQFGGFGNAVYITHPNGFTTVYGHLQSFSPELAKLVHDYQVQTKTDMVDFNLLPMQVPVTKGQVIALSGHTGAVAGPHVHFEVRDTQTEQTINPQLFGLTVTDHIPPVLGTACIYRFNDGPFSERTQRQFLGVVGSAGHYRLVNPAIIDVSGNVGFGITADDMNNTSGSHNGVYSIQLNVDGKTVFTFAAERFAFDQTHAINAFIDYPEFLNSHRFIQKCFILPGSKITLYPQSINRGVVSFTDDSLHDVQYVVRDIAGNTSTLNLKVRSHSKTIYPVELFKMPGTFFPYDKDNTFSNDKVKVSIPAGNLYDSMNFVFADQPKKPGTYSDTYQLGDRYDPINDTYDLWIKPDTTAPGWRADKAVIVNADGECIVGNYEDGYVKAQAKGFGSYYVKLDTEAPRIVPVNITNGANMAAKKAIELRISDNLSGIKTYMGYVDGQWVLMHWDFKSRILSYIFDETNPRGKHTFELNVTDQKDNTATFKADFNR